jgi:pyruvate-formate lyase
MAKIAPQDVRNRNSMAGWEGFNEGLWQREINLRDFIQRNYEEYTGDESFLASATERTKKVWNRLNDLFLLERKKAYSMSHRFHRPLPLMVRAISIVKTKSSLGCRPKRP